MDVDGADLYAVWLKVKPLHRRPGTLVGRGIAASIRTHNVLCTYESAFSLCGPWTLWSKITVLQITYTILVDKRFSVSVHGRCIGSPPSTTRIQWPACATSYVAQPGPDDARHFTTKHALSRLIFGGCLIWHRHPVCPLLKGGHVILGCQCLRWVSITRGGSLGTI